MTQPVTIPTKRLNLKSWGGISKLLNTYSGLANVEGVMDFDGNDILSAMPRLFWPQYNWQIGAENIFRIARAWHVYASPEGQHAFQRKHGIKMETFLKIAFSVFASTDQNPAVRQSFLRGLGVDNREIYLTKKIIGGSIGELSEHAKAVWDCSIPRDFLRIVIKERPLVEITDERGRMFLVPSRAQLILRITDGLYFDIVSDDNARRKSGERFEELCAEVMTHYLSSSVVIERERKTSFGKSADLFALPKNADQGLVVECKIRRLPYRVLVSPDPWRECQSDFDDVVKGIVQIWRTHDDLTANSGKDMVGVVVQYDPWTLMGGSFMAKLFEQANERADKLYIPTQNRIRVALTGFVDFEHVMRSHRFTDIHQSIFESQQDKFFGYNLSGILKDFGATPIDQDRFDYGPVAEQAVSWWGDLKDRN